jgi:hypothetical protein
MRIIFFVFFIFFIFAASLFAGDIYTYTNKDGTTTISNTPIPEQYEKKARKIDSYQENSPKERQRYEAEPRQVQQVQQVQQNNSQSSPSRSSSVDATCKQECEVNYKTCMSDSSRSAVPYKAGRNTDSYERASTKHDCTTTHNDCVNGCRY